MGRVLFKILVVPLLYLISLLPFWMLYGLSNFFYVIVFHLIGYRKKVVLENLRKSFPEKTEQEIRLICRQFYLHFCDVILETIKLLTISKDAFKKRCHFDEEALRTLGGFYEKKQSIVMVLGHCGNWEWSAIAHILYFDLLLTGVYHPLSNKDADRLIYRLRSRFGGSFVPMNQVLKHLLKLRQENIPTSLGLISDQTPPPEGAYWTQFLNQDTPVFNGTEKIAVKFDYPVVFITMVKPKRGHYVLGAKLLAEHPKSTQENEISEMHVRYLEKMIRQQPYSWLWSHRRWKHKKPVSQ